ncbi:MAG: SecY-interacting protein [Pseudomonadota bacterium]|nr:SecY-interacting protein [Pseudomonadota bacterium]
MALTIPAQLDKFVSSYVEQAEGEGLKIAFDSEWPSPCYKTSASDGELVSWAPVLQSPSHSFDNVEEALSLKLNTDFCLFFTRYYSDNLKAMAPQGNCELLQVFNSEDFERLQQNLIGHLLMKQRLKQAPTLFFGLTDEEDFILTIVNESGEVALEQVGREPAKILAPSLAVFLEQLTPRA